ncbi:unnamed protein product, partial [Rotaria magnacalcarata]
MKSNLSVKTGEKHNQTVGMLNDENHPTRTMHDENRPPLRK